MGTLEAPDLCWMQGATTKSYPPGYVEKEQRRRRHKSGLPRRGWTILDCDCVARPCLVPKSSQPVCPLFGESSVVSPVQISSSNPRPYRAASGLFYPAKKTP